MVYNRFRVFCITRVCLLTLTILGAFFCYQNTTIIAATMLLVVLVIYQIYSLIHYIETTNRDLSRFLTSIKYNDFSQSFSYKKMGTSFRELYKAFNEVMEQFQQARREKEEQFRYLQTVVQNIGVGIIVFRMDGQVDLINNTAKRLLRLNQLKKLDQLSKVHRDLAHKFLSLKPGQRTLFKFRDQDDLSQLALYAADFMQHQQKFRLISLQNIQSELEEKEMEAWQTLIRVLTHEIMNSVTPISSLASTARSLLTKYQPQQRDNLAEKQEIIEDVQSAVQTIEKRSQGLLTFVENYRQLTKIPKPDFQIFLIQDLFTRIQKLMQPQFDINQVTFSQSITPTSLELTADPSLVEQILINLLKNSIEALENFPQATIRMQAFLDDRGRIVIEVIDNGPGMEENVLENIFIPFFTTKKQGSGIGLSLSRQIMRLHGGSINARSTPNVETVFGLRF
jgi:two-component system, NtrC family, nitrogen regulation sensor histidine kinase NtrY